MPFDLVFMGTPDFAVPSLNALAAAGHRIRLVITQPDRPKGRGRKISPPPVKTAAAALGIPVIQPPTLRDPAVLQRLKEQAADFFIVVAYGHLLREEVLATPRLGCINVHASLLPRFRGPAPIQWAVIHGEKVTGVTTMLMDRGLDTGDILLQAEEPIGEEDTAGSLHDRLARKGAELLTRTLSEFASGTIRPTPQDDRQASYAPLLKKNDGLIDWKKPAAQLESFVRGVTPWPGAHTYWKNNRIKVFRARPVGTPSDGTAPPGTVLEAEKDRLVVACGEGALALLELQNASGSRLPVGEFLRGCHIAAGDVFG